MSLAAWTDANQRALVDALAHVRADLDAPARARGGDGDTAGRTQHATAYEPPADSALATVVRRFGLSPFERDVLVLAAGCELDGRFAASIGDSEHAPTFALALAALSGAHWSALAPGAPLRAWHLVEVGGASLTRSPLRIDERVLHYLTGIDGIDERLRGTVEARTNALPGPFAREAEALAQHLRGPDARCLQLCDTDAEQRLSVASAIAGVLDCSVLLLRAEDISASGPERAMVARLVARESVLTRALPVLVFADGSAPVLAAFVRELRVPVVVCAHQPVAELAPLAQTIALARPTVEDRLAWWRDAVGARAAGLNGTLRELATQFELAPTALASAVAAAADARESRVAAPGGRGAALWEACRRAARPLLDGLAERIEPRASWDDLVLPSAQVALLHEVVTHVRRRYRVYEEWGFARKSARGLGISALFAGPTGTGKTMAAEVLAAELRLDLYRIDLASVVSKYIGETEKNLKRLFDAAEGTGAILLFDEADALFGKRSEVRDSHDRYANVEISYLLQRMDAYRGLAILTTNMKSALDPAFLRRLRFVVTFPFPDATAREAIWRRVLPSAVPAARLRFERLAQLTVSGGHIRNIALAGAFRAADRDEALSMAHLADAARAEYAKLERTLSDAEARGWA